jgi:hypothetical protein
MKGFQTSALIVVMVAITFLVGGLLPSALSAEPADEARLKQIVVEANEIKNTNPGFEIKLWTEDNQKTYKIKDTISFKFKANQDCYVTLLDIGTDGTVYKIFPNKWHKSSRVKKDKVYTIPPDDSKYRFRVKGPVGIEYVKAIAAVDPLSSIKESSEGEEDEFSEIKEADAAMKNIKIELDKRTKKDWAETVVSFKVRKTSEDDE